MNEFLSSPFMIRNQFWKARTKMRHKFCKDLVNNITAKWKWKLWSSCHFQLYRDKKTAVQWNEEVRKELCSDSELFVLLQSFELYIFLDGNISWKTKISQMPKSELRIY